jgi:DNA-binding response OmpR family regulator
MIPNVLLIDDSLSVRVSLQHALTVAGFNVTACENGAAGRKALRTGPYALLLIDINLPDASGLEIALEARALPTTAKTPIIMLSGDCEVPHRIKGLSSGATDYIGKPFAPSYVVKRARQLTEVRGGSLGAGNNTGSGPLRILLVDDSPTFLNAFAERLRTEGHDVILAKSGAEALSFLAMQPVDGIVLDVFMPGISGLETCRRIKSTPTWADIPVMMLTGREDSIAKATGFTAGVDEYVVKSTDVASMAMRLGELLRRKRLERAAAKTSISSRPPPPSKAPDSPRDRGPLSVVLDKPPSSRGADALRDSSRAGASSEAVITQRGPESTRDAARLGMLMERAGGRSPDSQRNVSHITMPPETSRVPDSGRDPKSGSSPLFEQVLSVCGLPQFIGRSSLQRAFERAGVDVRTLTPEGLARGLGEVRQTLCVFLPAPEAERHMVSIAGLSRKSA